MQLFNKSSANINYFLLNIKFNFKDEPFFFKDYKKRLFVGRI